jgi:hypothetical protein
VPHELVLFLLDHGDHGGPTFSQAADQFGLVGTTKGGTHQLIDWQHVAGTLGLNIQRYSSYSRAAIIPQKWGASSLPLSENGRTDSGKRLTDPAPGFAMTALAQAISVRRQAVASPQIGEAQIPAP